VGPRTGLYAMEKRKISCLFQELNPGCPAHSLVTVLTELPRLILQIDVFTKFEIYFSSTDNVIEYNFIFTKS
jgi:hypothetical protein